MGALIETVAAGLAEDAQSMLTAVIRGALTELSFAIAQSADRAEAHAQAHAVVERLLTVLTELRPRGS